MRFPLVHLVGVEPTRLAALEPKSSVSAIPPQMQEEKSFAQFVAMSVENPRLVCKRLRFGICPFSRNLRKFLQ